MSILYPRPGNEMPNQWVVDMCEPGRKGIYVQQITDKCFVVTFHMQKRHYIGNAPSHIDTDSVRAMFWYVDSGQVYITIFSITNN